MDGFTPVPQLQVAQAEFALNLIKSQGIHQSFVISPISISIALAMVCLGAKNETAKQIRSAISYNASDEDFHVHFAGVFKELQSVDRDFVLNSVNRVYFGQQQKILDSFIDGIDKYYGGQFEQVDFSDSAGAAANINGFVRKTTRDKIDNLVDAESLNSDTKHVIVNAIYFNAEWEDVFDSEFEHSGFYVDEKTVKTVQMIKRAGECIYQATDEYQVVGIPYKNNHAFMFIILPREKNGLFNVTSKLNGCTFAEILSDRERTTASVMVPKFQIESDFEMNDRLKSLGITDMFDAVKADFSGIDGSKKSYVSKVLHKAFVQVNARGTEAAAATAGELVFSSGSFYWNHVDADHPFLYAIVDNGGNILFCGVMT